MDPRFKNVTGYYVYPNDAADIKAHPFFNGIRWNDLHLTPAPMIPKVRSWEDTSYFDDRESVDNPEERSDVSDSEPAEEKPKAKPASTGIEKLASAIPTRMPSAQQVPDSSPPMKGNPDAQKALLVEREKKRPRDKILRDKKVGKTALEIRKKGAFLGYTYRRPRGPALAFNTERGRQPFSSSQFAGLYAL